MRYTYTGSSEDKIKCHQSTVCSECKAIKSYYLLSEYSTWMASDLCFIQPDYMNYTFSKESVNFPTILCFGEFHNYRKW